MMGFELKDVGEGGDLDAQVVGESIVRTLMTMAFEAGQERPNEGASLSDTVLGNEMLKIAFAMKDACHEVMIRGGRINWTMSAGKLTGRCSVRPARSEER